MKIGKLYEISLGSTNGYIIYTHKNPLMGYLIWLLRRRYAKRPSDVRAEFCNFGGDPVFLPLAAAERSGDIKSIGTCDIPRGMKSFPLFVTGVNAPEIGLVQAPRLWDGVNDLPFPLSRQRDDYPEREIIMVPVLADYRMPKINIHCITDRAKIRETPLL